MGHRSIPGAVLPLRASAAVLAGGMSRRFGRDKALANLGESTLLTHILDQLRLLFQDLLVSSSRERPYNPDGAREVFDRQGGVGPLMGMESALREAKFDRVFIMACDTPHVEPSVVRRLVDEAADADCVVPVLDGVHVEPLFAVYRKTVLPAVERLLASGGGPIRGIFPHVHLKTVRVSDAEWFVNLNTPREYESYMSLLRAAPDAP